MVFYRQKQLWRALYLDFCPLQAALQATAEASQAQPHQNAKRPGIALKNFAAIKPPTT